VLTVSLCKIVNFYHAISFSRDAPDAEGRPGRTRLHLLAKTIFRSKRRGAGVLTLVCIVT
jgi:hypothetical protein